MEWERVPDNEVSFIKGKGQRVLWKGAYVTVMTRDSQGSEQGQRLDETEGEGVLKEGFNLYVVHGKVCERES